MGIYANLYDRFIDTVDSLRVNKEYRNEWLNSASVIDRTIDTRTQPDLSLPRDVSMIDAFLSSPSGQIFTNNQKSYQKMNVFSETRIPTDKFIISNTEKPTSHTPRPSNNAGKVLLIGDNPRSAPGHAGRLQMETSDFVINSTGISTLASFMGTAGFAAGILGGMARAATSAMHNVGQNLLNSAMATVSGVAGDVLRNIGNIAVGGSLGVDQRPELMINGQYYSVILNQIQQKSYKNSHPSGSLIAPSAPSTGARIGQALGQLGTSMATSAATSLLNAGTSVFSNRGGGNITDVLVNGTVSGEIASRIKSQLRSTGESTARHRYFINLATDPPNGLLNSFVPRASEMTINKYWVGAGDIDGKISGLAALSSNMLWGDYTHIHGNLPDNLARDANLIDGIYATYIESGSLELNSLNNQREAQHRDFGIPNTNGLRIPKLEICRGIYNTSANHFTSILPPASSQVFQAQIDEIKASPKGLRYYTDLMNIPFHVSDGQWTTILPENMNPVNPLFLPIDPADPARWIRDYIDVIFYNVRAHNKIHVRSIISGINEKVTPVYEGTTRYIGRVEKPIVYGGVDRVLDFSLILHAFAEDELPGIWEKVNFITSLTYPQAYLKGFMVPPLAKITIGNLYRNQSGYITSLTKTIDDKYTWDVSDDPSSHAGEQMPMTVKLDISFAIIDNQRYAGFESSFHADFGTHYTSNIPIVSNDMSPLMPLPAPRPGETVLEPGVSSADRAMFAAINANVSNQMGGVAGLDSIATTNSGYVSRLSPGAQSVRNGFLARFETTIRPGSGTAAARDAYIQAYDAEYLRIWPTPPARRDRRGHRYASGEAKKFGQRAFNAALVPSTGPAASRP